MLTLAFVFAVMVGVSSEESEEPGKAPTVKTKVGRFCGYKKEEEKLQMLITPPEALEVKLGDRVSIVCAATGMNTAEPYVYWVKGLGDDYREKGFHMGPVAIGKSVLYFEEVRKEDIDTYRCVVESCCGKDSIYTNVRIDVADDTCKDVYGIGHVVYSAVWSYKNWWGAYNDCQAKGMHLAIPKNEQENQELLDDVMKSFGRHPNANKFANENYIWIAAHDAKVEGTFESEPDQKVLQYNNFERRQPDNWKNGQDAVGMNRNTGYWDDSFEKYNRPYVCKCPEQ